MEAEIATVLQYEGIGESPNFVSRTSDGILYAAKGASGNAVLATYPIAVYKSIDNGFTWIKDVEYSPYKYAQNSGYRVAIAVDGNDKVHLAFGCWDKPVNYEVGYLCYASKPYGGSWSGVTDIATYTFPSYSGSENSVYSMVIDGLNQVHILYLVSQPPYYFEHHWYDGSWHKETVYGGGFNDFAMLVVDPDNTIYQLYEPGNFYAKKPLGGSWSTHAIPDFAPTRFCCDMDGNLHFCNAHQYQRLKSNGEWDALEEFEPGDYALPSISVSQDGIVHIVGYDLNPYPAEDYQRHWQRSVAGVWSWESVRTTSYSSGSGTSPLHALFPVHGAYYPCLLKTGYAFVFLVGLYSYRFAADPVIPATLPSDDLSRVTGIRHIYRPGSFRMMVSLGDVSNTVEIAEARVKELIGIPEPAELVPPKITEPEPPTIPPEEPRERGAAIWPGVVGPGFAKARPGLRPRFVTPEPVRRFIIGVEERWKSWWTKFGEEEKKFRERISGKR